jgi:hypothetical protein
VSDKLLNNTKHSKHALLHLLDLGILPLSDAVKQASKPLICCGMVSSYLLLKLSKPGLLSRKLVLSLLLYRLLK